MFFFLFCTNLLILLLIEYSNLILYNFFFSGAFSGVPFTGATTQEMIIVKKKELSYIFLTNILIFI